MSDVLSSLSDVINGGLAPDLQSAAHATISATNSAVASLPSLDQIMSGANNALTNADNFLGDSAAQALTGVPGVYSGAKKAVGGTVSFFSDVPRLVTIVVGLLLITGGMFSLNHSSVIRVVKDQIS